MEISSLGTTADRSTTKLVALGISGCVLALAAGASATTHYGVLVGGALITIAFFAVAITTYVRDPVLAFIGLWVFVVFTSPLSAVFGYSSHTGATIRQGDEVLVLLFVFFTIRRTLKTAVAIPPPQFTLPGVGVAIFGIISALVHNVPLATTLVGALLGLKLWIMIVATLLLPWTRRDLMRAYRTVMTIGVIVASLGLLDYLTHGGVSRALHTSNFNVREGGYRAEAVHSIFPTPGEYSLFMSLLFGLSFSRFTRKYSRSDLLLALLFAGSIMLSLRLKGFLSLAAVVAIVGIAQGATSSRRAIVAVLLGSLLVASAYAAEGSVITKQVSRANSETSTRADLYETGEKIASDDFPLGVGFGRFASYPSRTSYSPVYYQYRLNDIYGLSPSYPAYIDDTSWPSVIGETGYGGFAVYAIGLILLIIAIVRRFRAVERDAKWVPLASLCAFAVLLVDSLGDPSLFSWLAVTTVAMILGPAMVTIEPAKAAAQRVAFVPPPRRGPLSGQPS